MGENEALKILLCCAYCSSPALSCTNCPGYGELDEDGRCNVWDVEALAEAAEILRDKINLDGAAHE